MQLQTTTAKFFDQFTNRGTLGEGAQRGNATMMDRIDLTGSADIVDVMVAKVDNAPGVDADPRAGHIRVGQGQLQSILLGHAEQQIDDLPTIQISKDELDQFKKELTEAGLFTEAEIDEIMKKKSPSAPAPAPAGPIIEGSVSREGETLRSALETVGGDAHEIEHSLSTPEALYFMRVTDLGDQFQALATHLDKHTGEAYRETLSGEWNLLPQ